MRELFTFGMKLKKRFVSHEISARSAQMTYYWVLAFFPFLIMIINILSFASVGETEFLSYITKFVPTALIPFVEGTINGLIQYRSATVLYFGAIASIWTASSGVIVLIKGIHNAYNAADLRAFWIKKLTAMFYTLILAILIAAMIILLIFGNNIGEYILSIFFSNEDTWYYGLIWHTARFTMPIIALLMGLYMIYKFVPRKHLKYKNVWPGTIFASIGWYVFSVLFSIYVNHYSRYNQMYGSIGGMFILLIWLYASGVLLLLGGEINALYQDTKRIKGHRE